MFADFKRYTILIILMFTLFQNDTIGQEEISSQLEKTDLSDETVEHNFNKLIGITGPKSKDINAITAEDLQIFQIFSITQINSFFEYKKKFGNFISIYELQAIPGWDHTSIRILLKFVSFSSHQNIKEKSHNDNISPVHQLYVRIGRSGMNAALEEQFKKGIRQTVVYRMKSSNNTSIGVSAEKDAGEKNIFDFTSFYFQKEQQHHLKKIIIGDYLIAIGQGLIQWNGYAFGKGANIMSVLRQPQNIKAHTGTEENRFFRGGAIEMEIGKFSGILFASRKRIDANIVSDSILKKKWVSSLLISGLHRSQREIEDKHSLGITSGGFILKHHFKNGHIGLNGIATYLDLPMLKRDLPYNTYSINGNKWSNLSGDFIFSTKSGTYFGEAAFDKKRSAALILGYLRNLYRNIDIGFQWRNISPAFNAFSSNIIGHRYTANNEIGYYVGINIKLNNKNSIEVFSDHYKHPFAVFSADGPQRGLTNALTYTIAPTKKWELYIRLIQSLKSQNVKKEIEKSHHLDITETNHIRIHAVFQPNSAIEFRVRNEIMVKRYEYESRLNGWLSFIEFILHPPLEAYSISIRSTYYNTDGFNASIYSLERDLPQYYSMNAYFNRGNSNYLLFQFRFSQKIHFSGKWVIDKKYFTLKSATNDYGVGIHHEWRTQMTIKF
jgi:hypothetical protein